MEVTCLCANEVELSHISISFRPHKKRRCWNETEHQDQWWAGPRKLASMTGVADDHSRTHRHQEVDVVARARTIIDYSHWPSSGAVRRRRWTLSIRCLVQFSRCARRRRRPGRASGEIRARFAEHWTPEACVCSKYPPWSYDVDIVERERGQRVLPRFVLCTLEDGTCCTTPGATHCFAHFADRSVFCVVMIRFLCEVWNFGWNLGWVGGWNLLGILIGFVFEVCAISIKFCIWNFCFDLWKILKLNSIF